MMAGGGGDFRSAARMIRFLSKQQHDLERSTTESRPLFHCPHGNLRSMSKKEKKKPKTEILSTEEAENHRKELLLKVLELKGACEKENERKKEFEKKLDHLLTVWKIQKEEFEKKKQFSKILKDREDLIDDQHHVQLDLYKNRIKYILQQNFEQISQRKVDSIIHLKSTLDQHDYQLNDTYRDKLEQKKISIQEELAHRQLILQMRKDRDHCLSATRAEFRLQSSEVVNHTENQLKEITQMMEKRVQDNLKKMESTKPIELMEQHDKEMQQIRKILNDKAHDNLDVIESLEGQLITLKRRKMKSDKDLNQLWAKNINLKDPLDKAQSNIILLEKKHEDYLKLKEDTKRTENELKFVCHRLKDVKWQYEVLFQQWQVLQKETDEYRGKLERHVLKAQSQRKF